MPRPPFFGDDTDKLVAFLTTLSKYHKAKRTQLSLTTMAQRVRAEFPKKSPPEPKPIKGKKGYRKDKDPLRHILFKLCRKHTIWFGQTF